MPEPKLTEDDLKDIVLAFSEARMKPYLNATNNYSDAIRISRSALKNQSM